MKKSEIESAIKNGSKFDKMYTYIQVMTANRRKIESLRAKAAKLEGENRMIEEEFKKLVNEK